MGSLEMSLREQNLELAEKLVNELKRRNLFITVVESCTGGALAHAITNIPGAGDVMKDGFITYSNEAKTALGVPAQIIDKHSVYSHEVAKAMADAGLIRSARADVSVGITGTLTRVDLSNPNSRPGEIFLAIHFQGRTHATDFRIKAKQRPDAKDELSITPCSSSGLAR
jgi:PncC family amidohydrolase